MAIKPTGKIMKLKKGNIFWQTVIFKCQRNLSIIDKTETPQTNKFYVTNRCSIEALF